MCNKSFLTLSSQEIPLEHIISLNVSRAFPSFPAAPLISQNGISHWLSGCLIFSNHFLPSNHSAATTADVVAYVTVIDSIVPSNMDSLILRFKEEN